MVIDIKIPLEPRTKKNSQIIAKVGDHYRIIPSKAYRQYEKECKDYVPPIYIKSPINVEAHYYMGSRRRVDLCNLHEALCDILVKYNCIEDDNFNIIASLDGSRVHYDKENPRTEITITTL